MAGVEQEQYATGNQMSNHKSEKQSFPNTNLDRLGKTGRYLQQLGSFTFLCIYRTRLDNGCSQLCCTRLEWVRTISAPVTLAIGKTSVAPTTSKIITTARWLALNWNSMPLVMKCQITNQKSKASPTQIWIALAKLVATYSLAASLFCALEPVWTMAATSFAVLDSNGSEQFRHLWHLRLAKPVWLPRKAKVPLHGGWQWTGTISSHWPWNVKSTMRKDRSSQKQNKPGSSWENGWLPTTSQLHFFALCNLFLGPF